MKLSQDKLLIRKKLYLIMGLAFAVIYTVYCFAISPALVYTANDIAYEGTVIPALLDYLGRFAVIVAISVAYAVIVCGAFRFDPENFKGGIVVFIAATLYKYTANVTMDWIMKGSISVDWIWDIVNIVFYTALEAIQLAVVWAVVKHFAAKNRGVVSEGYPFERFYDKKNHFLRAAFFCALTVFISKIFGRFVNDLYSLVLYGFPEKGETWLIMATAYIFEAVFGLLCYVIIVFALTKLMDKLILNARES